MRQKPNNKKLTISIFIIAVMVLSTFGFIASYQTTETTNDYNGFKFTLKNKHWVTEAIAPAGKKEFTFKSHPTDLTEPLSKEITAAVRFTPTIILTFDPNITQIENVDEARFELTQFLAFDLGKNVVNAVMYNSSTYQLPVEDCTPSSDKVYITFLQSNTTEASINNNCITIASPFSRDYITYVEKLMYTLLNIIPEQ